MTNKDLEDAVARECPDMLSHGDFMENARRCYCAPESGGQAKCRLKNFSYEEYEAWCKLGSVLNAATVEQLVDYLQENFSPDEKLCYMDCVEGLKNDCAYVAKDQLGKRFFYYAGKLAEWRGGADGAFPHVDGDDVVVC